MMSILATLTFMISPYAAAQFIPVNFALFVYFVAAVTIVLGLDHDNNFTGSDGSFDRSIERGIMIVSCWSAILGAAVRKIVFSLKYEGRKKLTVIFLAPLTAIMLCGLFLW